MVTLLMYCAWGVAEGRLLSPIQIQFTALIDEVSVRLWVLVGIGAYRPTVAWDRSSATVQATSEPDSQWIGKVPDLWWSLVSTSCKRRAAATTILPGSMCFPTAVPQQSWSPL